MDPFPISYSDLDMDGFLILATQKVSIIIMMDFQEITTIIKWKFVSLLFQIPDALTLLGTKDMCNIIVLSNITLFCS